MSSIHGFSLLLFPSQEYRDSFNHFDKDNTHKLERLEFRACLVSLGYNIPQMPTVSNNHKSMKEDWLVTCAHFSVLFLGAEGARHGV
jgi:hypothetical protein